MFYSLIIDFQRKQNTLREFCSLYTLSTLIVGIIQQLMLFFIYFVNIDC